MHGSYVHAVLPTIRSARPGDETALFELIRELAEYERLASLVTGDAQTLARDLFGAHPRIEALLAEVEGEPVGYALFFSTYSTFLTRAGLFLEDLFVRERYRGRGIGRLLLQGVARAGAERGAARVEWAVLDWNERAIGFYEAMGAKVLREWRLCRLTGAELGSLAAPEGNAPSLEGS